MRKDREVSNVFPARLATALAIVRRHRTRPAAAGQGAGRLTRAMLLLAGLLAFGAPAAGQDSMRIAAVVNDEVISGFDLYERIQLALQSANMPVSVEEQRRVAPGILRELIDERLRLQEAARQNVRVTDSDLGNAITRLERNNNIPPGEFRQAVQQNGMSPEAVLDQIRAQLAWEKFLALRVQPTIEIGEAEIDAVLERIRRHAGSTERRVAEIVLPVDAPGQEVEMRELADSLLDRIRQGAGFAGVASQFSQSASALNGGDIGWVFPGQLAPEIDRVVQNLGAGNLAGPIRTPEGFRIVMVIETRVGAAAADTKVALRQATVPADSDPAAFDGVSGCPAFAAAATALGVPQPDAPTRLRVADLNERLRTVALSRPVGVVTGPVDTPAGRQYVMICDRDGSDGLPGRDTIRDGLTRERLEMLSRRYLRDLRRAAVVDRRL